MSQTIFDILTTYKKITFSRLQRLLGETSQGNASINLYQGVTLWAGMSENLAKLLHDFNIKGYVKFVPCDWRDYLCDGALLNLPVIEQNPRIAPMTGQSFWQPALIEFITKPPTRHTGALELSICIPHRNRSQLLENCLKSIIESSKPDDKIEVIIADNNSDDNSPEIWAQQLSTTEVVIKVIKVDGKFFSKGKCVNAAILASTNQTIYLCDADILVCREVLERGVSEVSQGNVYCPIYWHFDDKDHKTGHWLERSYGTMILSKSIFDKNGFPTLKTWGRDDDIFFAQVSAITTVTREKVDGFSHQWHPDTLKFKDRYSDPAAIKEAKHASD